MSCDSVIIAQLGGFVKPFRKSFLKRNFPEISQINHRLIDNREKLCYNDTITET